MIKKFGIGLIYLARIIAWLCGLIAVAAAAMAWVIGAPFAAVGIMLMGEPVHFNFAGVKEMVVDIWGHFQ